MVVERSLKRWKYIHCYQVKMSKFELLDSVGNKIIFTERTRTRTKIF